MTSLRQALVQSGVAKSKPSARKYASNSEYLANLDLPAMVKVLQTFPKAKHFTVEDLASIPPQNLAIYVNFMRQRSGHQVRNIEELKAYIAKLESAMFRAGISLEGKTDAKA